jgi:acyl dehydratase
MQRGWWLEDAIPGRSIRHPGGRTIGADEHPRLAWLTDNASDVHGDVHRAAATPHGQPLVLGALSAAVVIGLAEPAGAPPADSARAVERGWSAIALTATVKAGDTLVATSRVEAVTRDEDGRGGFVRRRIEGRNQHGIVVVRVHDERWAPTREGHTTDGRHGL